VQACLTSGLLLTGTLYLVHAEDIPAGRADYAGTGDDFAEPAAFGYRILIYRVSSAAWARAMC
jgi:hypothetical protein